MRRTVLALSLLVGLVSTVPAWAFSTGTPEDVGLSSQRLQRIGEVFKQAKLPEGLLEIVTGDGSTGAALVERLLDADQPLHIFRMDEVMRLDRIGGPDPEILGEARVDHRHPVKLHAARRNGILESEEGDPGP